MNGVTSAHRRRSRAVPAVRLGQARAARDGRPRGDARRGARAARDDRPPVRAGRPAQAEGGGGRHPHAERLRARPLAQERDGVRDDGHHGAALARRARGRHGARAHPRRQPRRAGDDARVVLRHDRRLHRPVRLLLRRRRTATTTTTRASSSLFLVSIGVYIVSFFLMQALSRYREFAADRGAAIITGRPSALASALRRSRAACTGSRSSDLRAHVGAARPSTSSRPARARRSAACSRRTRRWRSASPRCRASSASCRATA